MNTHRDKTSENKSQAVANSLPKIKRNDESAFQFVDNRPEAVAQRELQEIVNNSPQLSQIKTLQRMVNSRSRANLFASSVNNQLPANAIQLFPKALDNDTAKVLGSLHSDVYGDKEGDDYTAEELAEIKTGVFMLTDLAPKGMAANCIGWAQNSDSIEPTGNLYTWKKEYTATAPDAADAKIILWGTKDEKNEDKWDVAHASVLLTHTEIVDRSKKFGGFKPITKKQLSDAGISNPCWTSAGGFGYGVIVHPRNWYEGGAFGTALKGMK